MTFAHTMFIPYREHHSYAQQTARHEGRMHTVEHEHPQGQPGHHRHESAEGHPPAVTETGSAAPLVRRRPALATHVRLLARGGVYDPKGGRSRAETLICTAPWSVPPRDLHGTWFHAFARPIRARPPTATGRGPPAAGPGQRTGSARGRFGSEDGRAAPPEGGGPVGFGPRTTGWRRTRG